MRTDIIVRVAGLFALADALQPRLAKADVRMEKLKPHFGAEMR